MTYLNNIPQGNQTIASSQPQIQGNFGFIQTSLQTDHHFNDAFATEGVHKQTTLANIADPGALPAGCNGIYYMAGGIPKFYDGTSIYKLAPLRAQVTWNNTGTIIGTAFNCTVAGTGGGPYTITFTVPLPNVNGAVCLQGFSSVTPMVETILTYTVNAITCRFVNSTSGATVSSITSASLMIVGP